MFHSILKKNGHSQHAATTTFDQLYLGASTKYISLNIASSSVADYISYKTTHGQGIRCLLDHMMARKNGNMSDYSSFSGIYTTGRKTNRK